MRMIKALLTGARFGIVLERYLNDIVYECHETDRNTRNGYNIVYSIEVPNYDKTKRLISASGCGINAVVLYDSEKLVKFSVYNSLDNLILQINALEEVFIMRINDDDKEPSKFKFEDMRSPDFLFNFDIEFGIAEAIKEYMQEIDEFISEYGFRQYLK